MQIHRLSDVLSLTFDGGLARAPTRAHETMLAILALAAGMVLAAMWGVAAGSASATIAVSNLYKVPLVILLSAITALPAGLVALRMTRARLAPLELATAFATSIFGGALVLATLAPIVAIYYHTSARTGVSIAIGSAFVALASASVLFVRAVARRVRVDGSDDGAGRTGSIVAVLVLVLLFVAALSQYVAVASPIIADATRFDGGVDSLFTR